MLNETHTNKYTGLRLNSLIGECLDRHAPVRRTKMTRTIASSMKDTSIQTFQEESKKCRYEVVLF